MSHVKLQKKVEPSNFVLQQGLWRDMVNARNCTDMETSETWHRTGALDGDQGGRREGPYRVTHIYNVNSLCILFMLIFDIRDGSI